MFTRWLALCTILVFLAPNLCASDTAAPQILRFAVVINGRTGGSEVDTFGPNGQLDSTFEFNDRGRGPKVTSHYAVSANGLLSHVDITGNDYLKAPVDEHFAVEYRIGRALPRTGRLRALDFISATTAHR